MDFLRRVRTRVARRCARACSRASTHAARIARAREARVAENRMTPTRKRRLIAVALILAAVSVAATLTVMALSRNMTYLFSPSEVLSGSAPSGANFKLGGVVLERSIQRDSQTLRVDFTVTDRFHEIPVAYTGILPDLFREGQSIIATGRMEGGR